MNATTSSYAELNTILDQARSSPHRPPKLTDHQLVGLQRRWCTALSARLDCAIEFAGPRPLLDAVASAWRELATEEPTLRLLIDGGELTSPALTSGGQRSGGPEAPRRLIGSMQPNRPSS